MAFIDPLGLQSKSVKDMGFGDKLTEVLKRALPILAGDIRDSVNSAFDNMLSDIATTAAIFAVFAALQATPIGWIADAVMMGLAYYEFGRAGINLILTLVQLFNQVNSANCDSDLDTAARTLASGLNQVGTMLADRANFGSKINSVMANSRTGARGVPVNVKDPKVDRAKNINEKPWRNEAWDKLSSMSI